MCNVTLHIHIPVSMGKQYTFKLYFVKPLLEIKLPFWACLSSLSIILILCSTVQCKKKSSLWNIYHNILKGLRCLFRPQLLPIAQIQSPFFSYGLCFQCDENVGTREMRESNITQGSGKKCLFSEFLFFEFLHRLTK